MWFYRDQSGTEVDLLVEGTHATILVEAKSGSRVAPDGVQPLQRVADALREYVPGKPVRTVVVYGGAERATLLGTELLPWSRIDEFDWA